jgi:hypothetical protein
MTLRLFFILVCTLLAVSGCVIEPYGGGGRSYYGGHDDGHRVWH